MAATVTTPRCQGARLLALNNGPVWQIGNEIVTGLHADHIRFPELSENLYSRPTMLWALDNAGAPAHRVEAAYLASNLSWNADYVLTVGRDNTVADLDGWVTLTNTSGTTFNDARLQLVAAAGSTRRGGRSRCSAPSAERLRSPGATSKASTTYETGSTEHVD